MYRAAGVSLYGLRTPLDSTQALFDVPVKAKASEVIHGAVDRLVRKFGRNVLFLGSSHKALKARGEDRKADFHDLDIIYMGEVR